MRLAVSDLGRIVDLYEECFAVGPGRSIEAPELGAQGVEVRVNGLTIELLTPTHDGIIRSTLSELGEGLVQVVLSASDLQRARFLFPERLMDVGTGPEGEEAIIIEPSLCMGARLVITPPHRV